MTPTGRGASKSAAPVGNNVGKARHIYPSVLNSLVGVVLGGHETGWSYRSLMRLPLLHRLSICLLLCHSLSSAGDKGTRKVSVSYGS